MESLAADTQVLTPRTHSRQGFSQLATLDAFAEDIGKLLRLGSQEIQIGVKNRPLIPVCKAATMFYHPLRLSAAK